MNTALSGSQHGSQVWLSGENQGLEGCRDALVTWGWLCPQPPTAPTVSTSHHRVLEQGGLVPSGRSLLGQG